jgi:4-hydroxy-tetrahydrodipicolinate synthase
VIVHCGAQTTAETAALSEHAAASGAAGVAVIGPPYFALDEPALLAHFTAAARACAPVPFYVYEFKARSGYAVPVAVIERLREATSNLMGLKVSDRPLDAVQPYLLEGLDVFVGAEDLLPVEGAAGTVSGLASVFPERVAALDGVGELRATLDRFPFHGAAKYVLGRRGVPVREDVRAPLRKLTESEKRELDEALDLR